MRLTPVTQGRRFFELFRRQGQLVSETLTELSKSLLEGRSRHPRLRDLEHRCDNIAADIYNLTNRTFTTPMDRSDILLLAQSLDNVVDLAEEVADKIELYKIDEMTNSARDIGECLAKAGIELSKAVEKLERPNGISPLLQEVHRLENEGDRITREALRRLFTSNGLSSSELIKWKDVYDLLEATMDECESVAEIVETITIKGA